MGSQGVLDGRESWKRVEALHVEVAGKLLSRKDLLPVVSKYIPSERRLKKRKVHVGFGSVAMTI